MRNDSAKVIQSAVAAAAGESSFLKSVQGFCRCRKQSLCKQLTIPIICSLMSLWAFLKIQLDKCQLACALIYFSYAFPGGWGTQDFKYFGLAQNVFCYRHPLQSSQGSCFSNSESSLSLEHIQSRFCILADAAPSTWKIVRVTTIVIYWLHKMLHQQRLIGRPLGLITQWLITLAPLLTML